MIMRIRYQKLGGHYHCRLFTARKRNQTFAKCGDLVFDEQEWPEVVAIFVRGGAEVLQDEDREAHLDRLRREKVVLEPGPDFLNQPRVGHGEEGTE